MHPGGPYQPEIHLDNPQLDSHTVKVLPRRVVVGSYQKDSQAPKGYSETDRSQRHRAGQDKAGQDKAGQHRVGLCKLVLHRRAAILALR